jgi:hypothetical protein
VAERNVDHDVSTLTAEETANATPLPKPASVKAEAPAVTTRARKVRPMPMPSAAQVTRPSDREARLAAARALVLVGKPLRAAAREYAVPASTLGGFIKRHGTGVSRPDFNQKNEDRS